MKKGLSTLNSSTISLTNANSMLLDGANTISDGSQALSDGMAKFNKEGVQTICNYINRDFRNVSVRLEKLQTISSNYNNFTMLNDDAKGEVKFVMIMDGIKKDVNHNNEAILNDKSKEN